MVQVQIKHTDDVDGDCANVDEHDDDDGHYSETIPSASAHV